MAFRRKEQGTFRAVLNGKQLLDMTLTCMTRVDGNLMHSTLVS